MRLIDGLPSWAFTAGMARGSGSGGSASGNSMGADTYGGRGNSEPSWGGYSLGSVTVGESLGNQISSGIESFMSDLGDGGGMSGAQASAAAAQPDVFSPTPMGPAQSFSQGVTAPPSGSFSQAPAPPSSAGRAGSVNAMGRDLGVSTYGYWGDPYGTPAPPSSTGLFSSTPMAQQGNQLAGRATDNQAYYTPGPLPAGNAIGPAPSSITGLFDPTPMAQQGGHMNAPASGSRSFFDPTPTMDQRGTIEAPPQSYYSGTSVLAPTSTVQSLDARSSAGALNAQSFGLFSPTGAPPDPYGLNAVPGAMTPVASGMTMPPAPSSYNATQRAFYNQMMPLALEVQRQTGIDARVVFAQAALETGWGRSAPGNNFFGIKSHGAPGGQKLATTEVINGKLVSVVDSFRTYSSPRESVRDYVDFLEKNPRYAEVMSAKGMDAQIAALGRSGYATDSNYAGKVSSIAGKIGTPGRETSGPPPTSVSARADVPTPPSRPAGTFAGRESAVAEASRPPAPATPPGQVPQTYQNNPMPAVAAPNSQPTTAFHRNVLPHVVDAAVGLIPGVGLVNAASGLMGQGSIGGWFAENSMPGQPDMHSVEGDGSSAFPEQEPPSEPEEKKEPAKKFEDTYLAPASKSRDLPTPYERFIQNRSTYGRDARA
jgi:hypothetical protein